LDICPAGSPSISYSYPESHFLSWTDRIWNHLQFFNEKRPHPNLSQCPSLLSSSGAKFLDEIYGSFRPLDIYLYGETMVGSRKSVISLRERDSIMSGLKEDIFDFRNHLIPVLNEKTDPSWAMGEIGNGCMKTCPLTLPYRIRRHLQL